MAKGDESELLYESIQRVKENEVRVNLLATKLDEGPAQVASTEDEVQVT
jgi:Asp/Glu/hydantoin racemase